MSRKSLYKGKELRSDGKEYKLYDPNGTRVLVGSNVTIVVYLDTLLSTNACIVDYLLTCEDLPVVKTFFLNKHLDA